jgi:exopolysaccharide biosynthesis WecB/TagA/CpsF family protein
MTREAAPAGLRVEVDDVAFDACTERELVEAVISEGRAGRGGWIVTVNVDILRKLRHDESLRQLIAPATFVVADGMPIVWAARLQRTALPERVTGSSLIWSISAAAAGHLSLYLLGGPAGVPPLAADELRRSAPALRIVGAESPTWGFENDSRKLARTLGHVVAAAPDVVFCGLGFPKQELVIARLRRSLPGTWFLGCGAALAFAAGVVPRAPGWMHSLGLEWVHRLRKEPRRLFRRYVVDDLPYACALLARAARANTRLRGDIR